MGQGFQQAIDQGRIDIFVLVMPDAPPAADKVVHLEKPGIVSADTGRLPAGVFPRTETAPVGHTARQCWHFMQEAFFSSGIRVTPFPSSSMMYEGQSATRAHIECKATCPR